MTPPIELSARHLAKQLADGSLTATAVVEAHLDRIKAVEPVVAAFNTVIAERAMARAKALDEQRAAGATLGPLHGIPVALKDNLCTRGVPTTSRQN